MTTTEYITHFSLWCIGKAPLLIGCDITKMSNDTQMILMNSDAIAINQDRLGKQSTLKKQINSNVQLYSADLMNNAVAVLVLNRGVSETQAEFTWQDLNLTSSQNYQIYDIWQHKVVDTTNTKYTAVVYGHGVAFYKFIPTN